MKISSSYSSCTNLNNFKAQNNAPKKQFKQNNSQTEPSKVLDLLHFNGLFSNISRRQSFLDEPDKMPLLYYETAIEKTYKQVPCYSDECKEIERLKTWAKQNIKKAKETKALCEAHKEIYSQKAEKMLKDTSWVSEIEKFFKDKPEKEFENTEVVYRKFADGTVDPFNKTVVEFEDDGVTLKRKSYYNALGLSKVEIYDENDLKNTFILDSDSFYNRTYVDSNGVKVKIKFNKNNRNDYLCEIEDGNSKLGLRNNKISYYKEKDSSKEASLYYFNGKAWQLREEYQDKTITSRFKNNKIYEYSITGKEHEYENTMSYTDGVAEYEECNSSGYKSKTCFDENDKLLSFAEEYGGDDKFNGEREIKYVENMPLGFYKKDKPFEEAQINKPCYFYTNYEKNGNITEYLSLDSRHWFSLNEKA